MYYGGRDSIRVKESGEIETGERMSERVRENLKREFNCPKKDPAVRTVHLNYLWLKLGGRTTLQLSILFIG
jgi:hypothetical protein